MLEELIDNTKRALNIPITKPAKELYLVIDKVNGKQVLDSYNKSFIITKNEIKKLKDDYITMSMVDVMKDNYEKKLEKQREKMKYDSMSDEEKQILK